MRDKKPASCRECRIRSRTNKRDEGIGPYQANLFPYGDDMDVALHVLKLAKQEYHGLLEVFFCRTYFICAFVVVTLGNERVR